MKNNYSRHFNPPFSRRHVLQKLAAGGVWLGLGGLLTEGCTTKKSGIDEVEKDPLDVEACDDLSKVGEEELKKRENFGYEEVTPMPDKRCDNCNLYIPAQGDRKCGGCILFKGPVFEASYCTYWAPRV